MKARLQLMQYDSEMAIANQPFSAGVMDVECHEMLSEFRSELEDEKAEHSVMKASYRQVDDAYNQEAEEVAELMKQIQEKAESKMAGDSGTKPKNKMDPKDGKAGKSRSASPGDKYPSKGPPGPPGPPDDPPDYGKKPKKGPPGPPGPPDDPRDTVDLLQVFHHHGEAQLMLMTTCLSRTSLYGRRSEGISLRG